MNRVAYVVVTCGVVLFGALISQTVRAEEGPSALSQAHIERIMQNCTAARASLEQLHISDALLRADRGKLYEAISTKLLVPLSSRITLNRLDGLNLASTTREYDARLGVFRASYKEYEESMSKTLAIKCTEKPEEFYYSVVATRQKRQKLHGDTAQLSSLLKEYKTDFEAFAGTVVGSEG